MVIFREFPLEIVKKSIFHDQYPTPNSEKLQVATKLILTIQNTFPSTKFTVVNIAGLL